MVVAPGVERSTGALPPSVLAAAATMAHMARHTGLPEHEGVALVVHTFQREGVDSCNLQTAASLAVEQLALLTKLKVGREEVEEAWTAAVHIESLKCMVARNSPTLETSDMRSGATPLLPPSLGDWRGSAGGGAGGVESACRPCTEPVATRLNFSATPPLESTPTPAGEIGSLMPPS